MPFFKKGKGSQAGTRKSEFNVNFNVTSQEELHETFKVKDWLCLTKSQSINRDEGERVVQVLLLFRHDAKNLLISPSVFVNQF